MSRGCLTSTLPHRELEFLMGDLFFIRLCSLLLVYKKTVTISRTRKSRPEGAAFLLHKYEHYCKDITSDNRALSEPTSMIVHIRPVFRQIVRIVNLLVYKIPFRPDLPRRKPRVCGEFQVLFWAVVRYNPACAGKSGRLKPFRYNPACAGNLPAPS